MKMNVLQRLKQLFAIEYIVKFTNRSIYSWQILINKVAPVFYSLALSFSQLYVFEKFKVASSLA